MEIQDCYATQINKLCRLVNIRYSNKFKEVNNITIHQFMILRMLFKDTALQKDIAEALGCDRSTVNRVCKYLIDNRLITTYREPTDRRTVSYTITEQGKKCVNNFEDLWTDCEKEIEDICARNAFALQSVHRDIGKMAKILRKGINT